MAEKRVGIIGGSGLYQMEGVGVKREEKIFTPFGEPSDKFLIGEMQGREIVFLPRHGNGHHLLPSDINYRANIWAMKKLGVEWIISASAVGSLKKEIHPLDIVLIDQFYDRTTQRRSTFFGEGLAAHIMFAQPICDELRSLLYEGGQESGDGPKIHWGGTYVNMEGPAFSTKAESKAYRSMGMDVIGMTNLTEAKLAREAEICYATLAMVTDYDCWIEGDPEAIVNVEMIIENLRKNAETVKSIISEAILKIPIENSCNCTSALKTAIITDPSAVPSEVVQKLEPIIGKYFNK